MNDHCASPSIAFINTVWIRGWLDFTRFKPSTKSRGRHDVYWNVVLGMVESGWGWSQRWVSSEEESAGKRRRREPDQCWNALGGRRVVTTVAGKTVLRRVRERPGLSHCWWWADWEQVFKSPRCQEEGKAWPCQCTHEHTLIETWGVVGEREEEQEKYWVMRWHLWKDQHCVSPSLIFSDFSFLSVAGGPLVPTQEIYLWQWITNVSFN